MALLLPLRLACAITDVACDPDRYGHSRRLNQFSRVHFLHRRITNNNDFGPLTLGWKAWLEAPSEILICIDTPHCDDEAGDLRRTTDSGSKPTRQASNTAAARHLGSERFETDFLEANVED